MACDASNDRTLVRMLVRVLGVLPTGTVVELESGEWAVVAGPSRYAEAWSQPNLRIVTDAAGQRPRPAAGTRLRQSGAPPRKRRASSGSSTRKSRDSTSLERCSRAKRRGRQWLATSRPKSAVADSVARFTAGLLVLSGARRLRQLRAEEETHDEARRGRELRHRRRLRRQQSLHRRELRRRQVQVSLLRRGHELRKPEQCAMASPRATLEGDASRAAHPLSTTETPALSMLATPCAASAISRFRWTTSMPAPRTPAISRTGQITHNSIKIDDGNDCTFDSCDPKSGVQHRQPNPFYTCQSSCGTGFHAASRTLSRECGSDAGASHVLLARLRRRRFTLRSAMSRRVPFRVEDGEQPVRLARGGSGVLSEKLGGGVQHV